MERLVAHSDIRMQIEKMHERSTAGTRVSKKNESLVVIHRKASQLHNGFIVPAGAQLMQHNSPYACRPGAAPMHCYPNRFATNKQ